MLSDSSANLAKSLARLSSGSKIVSPQDDAAGLAVSSKFDAQINRIGAANSNVGNAISFSQTQDGFLQQVGNALNRMSELATLAQDVTKTTTDIKNYNTEFTQLAGYINDLSGKNFNSSSAGTDNVALFSGNDMNVTTDSEGKTFQMTHIDVKTDVGDLSAGFADQSSAAAMLTTVNTSIEALATDRATVGANISVLSSYSSQLGVLKDNISAANSRIKDVDVAQESTQFARYNILVQSGTAMLAQANTAPQAALKLLQ